MSEEGRIRSLDERFSRLEAALDKLLGASPGSPEPDQPSGRPASVAEQVRAELERAERERSSQRSAEEARSKQETLEERLAKLEEKPPVPPQPRRERVMWGTR